jgi:indole-3-glycerol phosphate synthase
MDEGAFERLLPRIPAGVVAVAMSGVSSGLALRALRGTRADAVLVGGALMCTPDPGATLRGWIVEARGA